MDIAAAAALCHADVFNRIRQQTRSGLPVSDARYRLRPRLDRQDAGIFWHRLEFLSQARGIGRGSLFSSLPRVRHSWCWY